MFSQWFKTASKVKEINAALLECPQILVSKAKDYSDAGLHWYHFSTTDTASQKRVRGSGADFTDRMAILRAWGEFVERYSFSQYASRNRGEFTSSGFASHVYPKLARENAVAELVERDVFLSCWLLNKPAADLDLSLLQKQKRNKERLSELEKLGFQVRLGLYGSCLGFYIGIVFIYSQNQLVIATSAKRSIEDLATHLVQEAVITVSDLRSPEAPLPIEVLPEKAQPLDHLRYYLNTPAAPFISKWLTAVQAPQEFPDFTYELLGDSGGNIFAEKTGYVVFRAASQSCQNLWFGPTRPENINLKRLEQIAGRSLCLEELNHEPHPLA